MTSGASRRAEILTPRARLLLPIFLLLLIALSVRQLWCALPSRVALSGSIMGTTWSVVLGAAGRSRDDLVSARAAIDERLAAIDGAMSTWDPDSELSLFNADTSGEPFRLSAATLEVLQIAQRVSQASGGAFDVTVGPLVSAWGFGAGARAPGRGPAEAELAAIRERVGFGLLEIDASAGTARKRHPELACDLSAIATGFAVDEVARTLTRLGWTDFLVEVGGEVRASGERPAGGPWRVGIERPDEEARAVQEVVALRDAAMATSGDYRSFYELAGRRLSHLVDPRTGRPVAHRLASVSVVHPEAVFADAWATALAVLGPEEGLARAEAEGIEAYLLLRGTGDDFELRSTPGFPLDPDAEPAAD
jgi:thiamine biosynthesis lipoprotein